MKIMKKMKKILTKYKNCFGETNFNYIDTSSKSTKKPETFADTILFFFILISISSLGIISYAYGYYNGILDNFLISKNKIITALFIILWYFIQIMYLYIGLTDCFGTCCHKPCSHQHCTCEHCKCKKPCYCNKYLFAHAHNILFLTILYICCTLAIFFLFINSAHINIGNLFSLIGIIITFSALSLAGKVSSYNSMIIVLSIFLLMQFGLLFWVL